MAKITMLKGNFVSSVIKLEYEASSKRYMVNMEFVACEDHRYRFEHGEEDKFYIEHKQWIFDNVIEATAKFEQMRNRLRSLGEFRNLNKGKIPDYRDRN